MRRERVERDFDAKEDSARRDAGDGDDFINRDLDQTIIEMEQNLAIDENALDEAWQSQPESYYKVAKLQALYVSRRDAAKQHLKITEAAADRDIRRGAAQDGEKIAAAEVAKLVELEKDVRQANEQLISAQHSVAVLQALCTAFEQRGKALSGMSSLYTTNYFQRSSAVGGESKVKDHHAETARREMADERRRRGM
jgi:hypothetical protein